MRYLLDESDVLEMLDGEVPDLQSEPSDQVDPGLDDLEQMSWVVTDSPTDGSADGIVPGDAQLPPGVGDVLADGLHGADAALDGLGEFVSDVLQDLGPANADQSAETMVVPDSDVLAAGLSLEPVEQASPPPEATGLAEPAVFEVAEQGEAAAPPGSSEPTSAELTEAVEESGRNADLLSDLSTMHHQTAMNTISNIR